MVEWGGHHGGWGGFGPPSYIVKKCPGPNYYLRGTFKAAPIANQLNNLMGRQNLFLINMSASDDTIRFTQSEIVLSQNCKTI